LKVHAPKDARRVTAMFPFGLVQDLFWDDFSESWMTRFLVPKDVADGTYEVPVVIVNANGTVTAAKASYTIDSKSAGIEVDVKPTEGGVEIRVITDEAAQEVRAAEVVRVPTAQKGIALAADPVKRTFIGKMALPPGKHTIRVV